MSQLKILCETIDLSIPEKIDAKELYRYLQAFTSSDHNTLLVHQKIAERLNKFEWIERLDYMDLLILFEKIEPFVKIKTQ